MSGKPVPEISDAARPYWDAADRGELLLQRCESCGSRIFYPRHWCPQCLGLDLVCEKASGQGEVYSYSVIHQAAMDSYASDVPYVLAIIALAEGPRMMTNLVNCPPAAVHVGMPVRVTFETRHGGRKIPQFEPAEPVEMGGAR